MGTLRWAGSLAAVTAGLALALLPAASGAPSAPPQKLGPTPGECKSFPPETQVCRIASRWGRVVVSPRYISPGGLRTFTLVAPEPKNVTRVDWGWGRGGGSSTLRWVKGCGPTDFVCVHRLAKNVPPSTTWEGITLNFLTHQGAALTQDFYAIVGDGKIAIEGTVTKNGSAAPGTAVFVRGKKGGQTLRTDAEGYYSGLFDKADKYVVGIDRPALACVVRLFPCVSSKLVSGKQSSTVDFKIDSCPPPGLKPGCILKNHDFPDSRIPALVVVGKAGPVQLKRQGKAAWTPAKIGDVIGSGDELRTGSGGYSALCAAHRIVPPTDVWAMGMEPEPVEENEVGKIRLDRFGSYSDRKARPPGAPAPGSALDTSLILVGPDARLEGTTNERSGRVQWWKLPDWSDLQDAQWNKIIDDVLAMVGFQHRFRPEPQSGGAARG